MANEEGDSEAQVDKNVKLMGQQQREGNDDASPAAGSPTARRVNVPRPVGAPEDEAFSKQTDALRNSPVK